MHEHATTIRATRPAPHHDGRNLDFSRIYHEGFRFVWRNLLYLGVPRASVEDAVQDVFTVVHRRLPSYEGHGSIKSWLYGIVRRVASHHRRTHQRAERLYRARAALDAFLPDLEVRIGHRRILARVFEALDELPEGKRVAFTLYYLEEMSGPEIAEHLGLELDTAYTRIKSARAELRRRLGHSRYEELEPWLGTLRHAARPPKNARRRGWIVLAGRIFGRPAAATAASSWSTGVLVGISVVAAVLVAVPVPGRTSEPPMDERERTGVAAHAASRPMTDHEPPVATEVPVDRPSLPVDEPMRPASPAPKLARPSPESAAPSAQPSRDALVEEVELMTEVTNALDEGRPVRALELLDRHAREHRDGQLRQDRAGYRAIALCEAGRDAQGRGEAYVFLRNHPRAALASRVRASCGEVPDGENAMALASH